MAKITYELRRVDGTAFSVLELDESDKSWYDAKADQSELTATEGTVDDSHYGQLHCMSGNNTVVKLLNAGWDEQVGNDNEARCLRCDIGCDPEPTWTCTGRS